MSGMKAKSIKATLAAKFHDFVSSIEDKAVRKLVEGNTIITGGAIASMLLGDEVRDFDMYFRTKEVAIAVANYYLRRFKPKDRNGIGCKISLNEYTDWRDSDRLRIVVKSAGIASEDGTKKDYQYFEARPEGEAGAYIGEVMQDSGEIEEAVEDFQNHVHNMSPCAMDKPRYRPVFISTNAITLSEKVQLVLRFFGDPDEIHKNYDFVHCTNYWQSWDGELVLHPAALESLLSRELFYAGSLYPVCSVIRLRKFIRRGWKINAGQILKICMQISELDLTNTEVLQDQLSGVDASYFAEVMQKVNDKDPERINAAYLVEVIDRMF